MPLDPIRIWIRLLPDTKKRAGRRRPWAELAEIVSRLWETRRYV